LSAFAVYTRVRLARGSDGGANSAFVIVGAALLAAAIVPLSTAYSVSEALVLIPGAPLVSILFLSQALNAILLLVLLPFMRHLARDPAVMGPHALGPSGRLLTGLALALVALSVGALAILSVF
jgi:Mn2+/Fe2+ NRAMP family transporter